MKTCFKIRFARTGSKDDRILGIFFALLKQRVKLPGECSMSGCSWLFSGHLDGNEMARNTLNTKPIACGLLLACMRSAYECEKLPVGGNFPPNSYRDPFICSPSDPIFLQPLLYPRDEPNKNRPPIIWLFIFHFPPHLL